MAIRFNKLARLAIRKLSAGSITEHGITFVRLANGDGVYSVNVMVDGQRIHRVIGKESEGVTRMQAEKFIEQARTDARAGRLNLPRGRKTALGFRDAAAKYLQLIAQEGGKDLKMKRYRLTRHLVPFFGDTPLSKLANFDVERYKKLRLDQRAERGRKKDGTKVYAGVTKAGTVNRELATLSHLLNKAVEWGWIAHRPAQIKRLKEAQGRAPYLTIEQSAKLIEAAKLDPNPHIHAFIVTGLETGMRRMEILRTRREHVRLDLLTISIPNAKAGPREQPITKNLAEVLEAHMATLPTDEQWLFPSPASASGHAADIRKAFRRVVKAAGLDPDEIVRHTLRHTAITHLVQAGVDLPTVKRISGHKTLIMVERYAHANGEHIQAAMNKLEARYRNSAKEPSAVYKLKAA